MTAVCTFCGPHRTRDHGTFETPGNPREFVARLKDCLSSLASRSGIRRKQVRGVGVSVPGLVDAASGELITLPFFPEYSRYPLAREIEKSIGISAIIENDCNLAAMALVWQAEAGEDCFSNFVLVDAGDVGLGAGIVLNRQLYCGHDKRFAAEFGHMVIDAGGPRCNCGRHGCLELFATDWATWRRFTGRDAELDRSGFERLVEAAETGDAAAIQAFRRTEEYLTIAIGNIGVALNPQVIILSGEITRVPGSVKRIRARIAESSLPLDVRAARQRSHELFLRGAACLASEKVFSRPSLVDRL